MSTYYVNEAAFALPDELGFVDRTLHRLESPLEGGEPLKVEVRRLPVATGKSLRELVDEDVAATRAKSDGYTVVEEGEVAPGGASGLVLRATLRALDVAFYQRKAHFLFESTWLIVAVTCPFAERRAADETFDSMVQSLSWRSD